MQGLVLDEVKGALGGLQKLNLPFSGPFVTPKGNRICMIYDYIVWEEEILALHAAGKATRKTQRTRCENSNNWIETELDPKFGAAQGRARYWNHP